MILEFSKFQGTGNDFIVIDNRSHHIHKHLDNKELIEFLCNRRFGIGADGLILLHNKAGYDFEMLYYNSDGLPGTMCGNGGRCIVAFAHMLQVIRHSAHFFANDKAYKASIKGKKNEAFIVALQMQDVTSYEKGQNFLIVDTGSPHYVSFTENLTQINVDETGRRMRNEAAFKNNSVNVNFAEIIDNNIFLRTYERGVEAETLSCGTGAVATAIASHVLGKLNAKKYTLKTPGGELVVSFDIHNNAFTNIQLEGPATFVYNGKINV